MLWPSFACAPHHTASDVISTRKSGAGQPPARVVNRSPDGGSSFPRRAHADMGPSVSPLWTYVQRRSTHRFSASSSSYVRAIDRGRSGRLYAYQDACLPACLPAGRRSCITSPLRPAQPSWPDIDFDRRPSMMPRRCALDLSVCLSVCRSACRISQKAAGEFSRNV